MTTTPEVRMALCRRRKFRQETAALIVFHKPTYCLKKANSTMQLALGGSISSTGYVYMPEAQLKIESVKNEHSTSPVADVIVRYMRNRPPRIPSSYHLSVFFAVY
ncbi:hypothetical protein AVEN_25222-1 [Araneus ventricosus]|uniref:Uncharacterized protein n=1 Tax=Araneus ventricosus TaxID=182803 RepID=A0A4Y2TQC4_ARAVE|nr:hypothetical protein AVEN_56646-1 [Araneus ventricosus]GBO01286.1 hypothetical protein AVEN_25222-1 [Araneus ventricosus]